MNKARKAIMDRYEKQIFLRYVGDTGIYYLRLVVALPFVIIILAYALLVTFLDWIWNG